MNKTNILHGVYAGVFQFLVGICTGNFWAGGLAAVLFFLGREVAQREYKLANGESVKTLKPWEGFDILKWGPDAKLDLAVPVVVTFLIFIASKQV